MALFSCIAFTNSNQCLLNKLVTLGTGKSLLKRDKSRMVALEQVEFCF